MFIIAGKNDIAIYGLELLLRHVSKASIRIIPNKSDIGKDNWQRSFRSYAASKGVSEISLEDAYKKADFFLSLEFDRIVSPEKFSTNKVYNIHFSALPAYKGMYTSLWPIRNRELCSGVSLHCIDAGIDTGDLISQVNFDIGATWVSRDLYFAYMWHSKILLAKNIESLLFGDVNTSLQPAYGSTYFSRKSIEFSCTSIDFKNTAWSIVAFVKSMAFREYQFATVENENIVNVDMLESRSSYRPGVLIHKADDYAIYSTIDYDVKIYSDRLPDIIKACESGDIRQFERYIKNCAGLNDCLDNGWTPLIVAAYNGSTSIVNSLITMGADVNRSNIRGTTPLMYAKDAFFRGIHKPLELLVRSGASIYATDHAGRDVFDYCSPENKQVLIDFIKFVGRSND